MMPPVTVGRIVHYVLASGPNAGVHRPAIVVNHDNDVVELTLFPSVADDLPTTTRHNNVVHDPEGKTPHSWHWPEPAGLES